MRLSYILSLVIAVTIVFEGHTQNTFFTISPEKQKIDSLRYQYVVQLDQNQSYSDESSLRFETTKKKQVVKSVLLSAIVPGAGEAYNKSWLKALGFFAAEVTLWSLKSNYHSKGDKKDLEMRMFADEHWSELRYWTYVYIKGMEYNLNGIPSYSNLDAIKAEHGTLPEDFIKEYLTQLRQWESQIPGFTHQLPSTKTQQYYEMIGKYPGQFGPAWDDASYDAVYNGFTGDITPQNSLYMQMRKTANDLYDKARMSARFILLNHIISAIDAGFTAKIKNREVDVRLSSNLDIVNREMVEFMGVRCKF